MDLIRLVLSGSVTLRLVMEVVDGPRFLGQLAEVRVRLEGFEPLVTPCMPCGRFQFADVRW
jgi:hypothetical protein